MDYQKGTADSCSPPPRRSRPFNDNQSYEYADKPEGRGPARNTSHTTPKCIRCDNGPESTSWAPRLFLRRGVRHALIQPGSPWQNGFAQSFIATCRSECLDPEVFRNLADAQ